MTIDHGEDSKSKHHPLTRLGHYLEFEAKWYFRRYSEIKVK